MISHYLEAIYYIRGEGESVRSARLADWLGVSRPTVTVAVRRMIRDGMVRITSGKEIELTRRGDQAAASVVRRHRITERWLSEVLGLDWVAADTEAARLEHAVSQQVEDRLYQLLRRPTTCPHGNPIPGSARPNPRERRLSQLRSGAAARISRISEVAEREAPALLHYLEARRLVPRTAVRILEVDEIGRTMRLRARDRDLTMSHETAGKIWVVPDRPGRKRGPHATSSIGGRQGERP
ncbi:MAG TPA: metal-dependent transcriptional regulator [Candidatus Limnocylindrales bacterium]|nr:metal-dependent transcriptional regulator [Candidatus Limnocylindrales bacterium]